MDELKGSSAMQNGTAQDVTVHVVPDVVINPQLQTGSSVSSPEDTCVPDALPVTQEVHNATGSFSIATEDNPLLNVHQDKDESTEKMDEKQDNREFNDICTVNNLTTIADSYSDSDTDHDGVSVMEIEQEGSLECNNNNNNSAQLLDVQSSTTQEQDITEVNVSPGTEVSPEEAKISTLIDLILTSEENKLPSDTTTLTTTTTKNSTTEVNEDLLCDTGYIMSIVGEELKSVNNCMDIGLDRSAGMKDEAKSDSFIEISSHEKSTSSDDESSSSSDITGNSLVIRERVAELEDPEEERAFSTPPKTKDELSLKDLPDEPEVEIEVDENIQLIPIGEVHSIVEVLVVIHALPHTPALDSGSYLFLESREYLGMVFEIFGPVQSPYYSIRFNSEKSLETKNIHNGVKVCFAPDVNDYSIFVFMAELRQLKGSDASWKHDQEPPSELVEYSDDEEEAHVKSKRKQEKKAKKTKETENTGAAPKQKQRVKVGRWSWKNQQQGCPSSEESTITHPQGSNQFHSGYRGPASVAPFIRPRPHFEMSALPGYPRGYPRGPPTAGFIRPSQGPMPPPGSLMGCTTPFMGNPCFVNGPPGPFGVPRFGHTAFMQEHGPPGHGPPGIAPYQHGSYGVAPYQHGPFYGNQIPTPPHGPPPSGPP